jgi:hypothetical protein
MSPSARRLALVFREGSGISSSISDSNLDWEGAFEVRDKHIDTILASGIVPIARKFRFTFDIAFSSKLRDTTCPSLQWNHAILELQQVLSVNNCEHNLNFPAGKVLVPLCSLLGF